MLPRWIALLLGAVVCILVAILLAPYIPEPGALVVQLVSYIGAVVCVVLAVLHLTRGGANL